MDPGSGTHLIKKAIWGVFLIALGVLFLLERMGAPGFGHLYAWWPLLLIVAGITHLVEGRVGGAITLFLLGGWFFVVTWGWHGLTYANSWPLALVAVGVGMVVKALTGEERHRWHAEGGPH